MTIKAPRLLVNRCGVYYFRIKSDGKEKRISLRTKCSNTANIIALQLNLELERKRAMTNPKLSDFDFSSIDRYEISLPNGMTIKTDGTQADHDRAMQALEKLGPIPVQVQQRRAAELEVPKSESLVAVIDKWLANCAGKNEPRTVTNKKYHLKNFLKLMFPKVASVELWLAENENNDFRKRKGLLAFNERKSSKAHESKDIEINALTKKTLTQYKSLLGSSEESQKAKTIDNKLESLSDLFKYAIDHELYTVSKDNPTQGLRIQNKKARIANTKSYQPFTRAALKTLFEPKEYLQRMTDPELFWGPLLGIYTGMRIGETTQIRCQDVYFSDNGVHYIHVYKSKTPGGIRNVPIAQALLDLGFLEYVEECKAAGAKRIFPHCPYINFSYYKELSASLLEHQRALSIKFAQTSFHSFRVNVTTELHNKDANAAKVIKIVGHEDGSGIKAQAVHWGYVRDLPDCKKIVDLLEWPIDLHALKYDGRFKSFVSDSKNWAPEREEELESEKTRKITKKKADSKTSKLKTKIQD